MYDFSKQAHMLALAIDALKTIGIYEDTSLGGGTALSAYYWEHRYSTDIDLFIDNSNTLNDIALGISKNVAFIQESLDCKAFSKEHLSALKNTLEAIISSKDLMQIYTMEINFIDPAPQYKELALNAPKFLFEKLS